MGGRELDSGRTNTEGLKKNSLGESAAFEIIPANGLTFKSSRVRTVNQRSHLIALAGNQMEWDIKEPTHNQRSGDFVEHASNNHRESHFVEQSQKKKNRRKAQVNKGTNRTRQASQQSVPTKNSFEPLQQNGSREPTSVEPTSTNTMVIIGDSMIKRVQGWKIARKVGHRVVVKAFPGATTSDMEHYLKPALAKDPRRVILHVGTNDLKSNLRPNPNQIADSIVDLARMIESESEAEVIISEVITRSDKTPEDHIITVNKLLSRYCNQNGWQLLRHNNISKDHLNDGGLHLNDQGVSILVTNLTRFLSE